MPTGHPSMRHQGRACGQSRMQGTWRGWAQRKAWLLFALPLAWLLYAPAASASAPLGACRPDRTAPSAAVSPCSAATALLSHHPEPCWCGNLSAPEETRPSERPNPAGEVPDLLAVPICLIEGASGIAPLPVHAVDDGRISSRSSCGAGPLSWERVLPSDSDEPAGAASDRSAAALSATVALPTRPWAATALLPRDVSRDRCSPGHGDRVYRPPRR